MRTAWIIGGLGPESTIDYYRSIIARYRARSAHAGSPHIILNSLDVDHGVALLNAGRLAELADYIATGVAALARVPEQGLRHSSRQIRRILSSIKSKAGLLFLF